MAKELREQLYTASMLAAAVLAVVGVVLLWGAISFEGHISALLLLAVAAVCVVAGRDLKASHADREASAAP